MERPTGIKINNDANLTDFKISRDEKYKVAIGKRKIKFDYFTGKKNPFRIVVKTERPENCKYTILTNVNELNTASEMLKLQKQRKDFYESNIKNNKIKIFTSVDTDEQDMVIKRSIEKSISFWRQVHNVEKKIKKNFKLKLPLNERDEEILKLFIRSFLKDSYYQIKHITFLDIKSKSKDLKNKIKAIETSNDAVYLLEKYENKKVFDVKFESLYKIYKIQKGAIKDIRDLVLKSKEKTVRIYINNDYDLNIRLFVNEQSMYEYIDYKSIIECNFLSFG